MLELVWATTCFASRKILGRGGFGNVYEGTLFDGSKVAVKRLNAYTSLQGDTEFNTEVAAIANLNHHNVVSLKGYCSFLRERILVYEYVPNKTLEYHLHGKLPSSLFIPIIGPYLFYTKKNCIRRSTTIRRVSSYLYLIVQLINI